MANKHPAWLPPAWNLHQPAHAWAEIGHLDTHPMQGLLAISLGCSTSRPMLIPPSPTQSKEGRKGVHPTWRWGAALHGCGASSWGSAGTRARMSGRSSGIQWSPQPSPDSPPTHDQPELSIKHQPYFQFQFVPQWSTGCEHFSGAIALVSS